MKNIYNDPEKSVMEALDLPQTIKVYWIKADMLGIHMTRSPNPVIHEKAAMELSEYE